MTEHADTCEACGETDGCPVSCPERALDNDADAYFEFALD